MEPNERALRFEVKGRFYAVDVQANKVRLLFMDNGKWVQYKKLNVAATQADVDKAGGITQFVKQILPDVNQALQIIQGNTSSLPAGTTLADKVQDVLNDTTVSYMMMDGLVQLKTVQ